MHVIDLEALSQMFFGDQEKVTLVVDALIQRIPEWQQEVQQCSDSNDIENTRQLCHRIRGAAGSVKAEKLAEAATQLGNSVKSKEMADTADYFSNLSQCLDELLIFTIK